jgi:hypothetical protein
MKASRVVLAAVSLLLVVAAQDVFAQRRWRAKEEVEAGGWYVAYGNELSEDEAARGMVESWVSLQSGDRDTLRTWSDSLLRQAIALMVHDLGPEGADSFSRDEQREARRFSVETIRDLLGSRTAGAQILVSGSVEVKAGVMEYRDRSADYSRRRETVFMPYIALRLKYGRRHHHSEYRDDWRNRNRDERPNYEEHQEFLP